MLRTDFPQRRTLLLLCAFAAIGFLPAVFFYYVGEEAIFPISSLEMWRKGIWLKQIMYGANIQHNTLFNWVVMVTSAAFGWHHVLEVTRILAIFFTLASAWALYRLAKALYGEGNFPVFAALSYLSLFDISLYHGWLAYVDPFYSFLVFSAMALLWLAAKKESLPLLASSLVVISASFLAKAFTAYVFYAGTVFVLLFEKSFRKFLVSPKSILAAAVAAGFPLFWFSLIPSAGQGGRMFAEILHKLELPGFFAYLKQLTGFPLEVLLRMSPLAILAVYYLLRGRVEKTGDRTFRFALAIGLVNLLPYWLSPQSGIRYIMPLYPFFALALSRMLWNTDRMQVVIRWMSGFLVLRFFCLLLLFPWYQSHYRGENYYVTAQKIIRIAKDQPLYITDVSASGLSVTGYIDVQRLPADPITFPPQQWNSGYVIAYTQDPALGSLFAKFRLGGDEMYLLCRGSACGQKIGQ